MAFGGEEAANACSEATAAVILVPRDALQVLRSGAIRALQDP